jgi:sec-independent protein translocase protein TatB
VPGIQELLVIAVVALLVFGPERLPGFARSAGEFVARFRAVTQGSIDELKQVAEVQELDRELKGLRRELQVTRGEMGQRVRGLAASGPTSSRSAVRADDDPPPIDPEAT